LPARRDERGTVVNERPSLTLRQQRCVDAITEFSEAQGFPPTIRELGLMLNLRSSATVASLLNELARKGYVTRVPLQPRTLRVLRAS
jgi:repressor LexA